jgi:6-phosphogluconolactonase (cycloisomerase 2 family)
MLEFDTIAAFDINGSTGVLTPVNGSPFGGNISPFYGTSDPAGKFLYAVDQNNGRIYGFSIDATTGALTAVPGSPYSPSASQARIPLVDPSGSFLYVTHQDSCGDDCQGAVSAYKINADGSLTEITGSPYSTDYGTFGIAIQPSGKFLYTMNGRNCCRSANTISVFQVDPASGALTPINGSPFTAAGTPFLAAIHPNGNFLYAISGGEGFALVVYSIGASGTPSATSAFYQLGQNPQSLDIDAIDNFLFVGDNGSTGSAPVDGSIRVYRMNAVDGTLMPVTGSPFTTTGSNPLQVAVDRSCRFLYVTNNNPGKGMAADYVLGFAIDPLAGTLTAVPGSPFATPSGGPPQGIVLTPHGGAPTVP